MTQTHGVRRILMVGTARGPDGKDALTCGVAEMIPPGMKADLAGVEGALQEWVGAAPLRANGEFAEFAYREARGLRTPVPASEDPLANGAPPAPPNVAEVTISYGLGMLMITYGRSHEGGVEERPFGGAPSP